MSVKAAKEWLKEGRNETKIPFKFQLYFEVSYSYSVARNILLNHEKNSFISQTKHWNVLVVDKSKVEVVMSSWCFRYRLQLTEMAATGKRVSQWTVKWTCVFLHKLKRSRSSQSKWSLLNEKEFLSHVTKSVFRHVWISLPVRGFWLFFPDHYWLNNTTAHLLQG